jgi:hypothetical protein
MRRLAPSRPLGSIIDQPSNIWRSGVSPVRVWFGLVFLAMGVLAILDATGALIWSDAFDEWWPLAIVGWGVVEMAAHRRVELGGVVVTLVGLALLADQQSWAAEAVVWSVLFLLVGAAILGLGSRRKARPDGEDRSAGITSAAQG